MSLIGLLDGGLGSELIARGEKLPKHLWSAYTNHSNPKLIHKIHCDYIMAGSTHIITNTFRTSPRSYLNAGFTYEIAMELAYHSLITAVKMAQSAAKNKKYILGSIAPLEDCYMPHLFPGVTIAIKEFYQLGLWLKKANVDAILLETMNSIIETKCALIALNNLKMPIWVSFYINANNNEVYNKINDIINLISDFKIELLLFNCININLAYIIVDNIVNNYKLPWGIYPNLGIGLPSPIGKIINTYSNVEFLKFMDYAIYNGASIIGGCCGSSPLHISLLKKRFFNDN